MVQVDTGNVHEQASSFNILMQTSSAQRSVLEARWIPIFTFCFLVGKTSSVKYNTDDTECVRLHYLGTNEEQVHNCDQLCKAKFEGLPVLTNVGLVLIVGVRALQTAQAERTRLRYRKCRETSSGQGPDTNRAACMQIEDWGLHEKVGREDTI